MRVKTLCPNPACEAATEVDTDEAGPDGVGRCRRCGEPLPDLLETRADGPATEETEGDPPPARFGRYAILRRIGRGGMGSVYLADDPQLERQVALKVPHLGPDGGHEIRGRFLREARAAAQFRHPNFCPIHDIGEVDGVPYLTMAFIPGRTLADSIEPRRPWPQRRAAEVARILALALAEAHRRGVVHRDLKPANVMVDDRGTLILMDFGLALRFDPGDPKFTATGMILGTPAYMPPEQAEGDLDAVGPRSDIYSLGVILYELLTGRRPFEGSTVRILGQIALVAPTPPSVHHPAIDPGLEAICLKAIAKKPADRHASMDDLAEALDAWLRDDARSPESPTAASTVVEPPAKAEPPADSLPGPPAPARGFFLSLHAWKFKLTLSIVASVLLLVGVRKVATLLEAHVPYAVRTAPAAGPVEDGQGSSPIPPTASSPVEAKQGHGVIQAPPLTPPPPMPVPVFVIDANTPPGPSGSPPLSTRLEVNSRLVLDTNSIGMRLARIPGGTFLMGSPESDSMALADERPQASIKVAPFLMGVREVTQDEYRAVTGEEPSFFKGRPDHPVEHVSWLDAVAFCNLLSGREGLPPYYERKGSAAEARGGAGYRLPTEAEWEYACRAGSTARYSFGDDPAALPRFAWYREDSGESTHPAGRLEPNAFGLLDMHGNVKEWCGDAFAPAPGVATPPPPDGEPPTRVHRGGSWAAEADQLRSAARSAYPPTHKDKKIGFRLARDAP